MKVSPAAPSRRPASPVLPLETGVWIVSQLVSFDSYGIAPGALIVGGRALGPPQFGPKRLPMSSGLMPTGGLAVLRIRLLPVFGFAKNATLQVNCALGDVPRERSVDGIRLALERNGTEFSEEVRGRVMFLSMHPEVSAPAKTPQQETAPDSSALGPALNIQPAPATTTSNARRATLH